MNRLLSRLLCCAIALFAAAHASAQIPTYVPTDGLVGWWPFNGNANDESGNGNNGVVYGPELASDRDGVLNQCYAFNGEGDWIRLNQVNISETYSISAWFQAHEGVVFSEAESNSNSGATILCQGSSNYPCNFCDFGVGVKHGPYWGGNGCENTYLSFERGSSCSYTYYERCGEEIDLIDVWHHVLFTFDASGLRLYVNGIEKWEELDAQPLNHSGFPMSVGRRYVANNNAVYGSWKGLIDDIGIWNRALTAEEVMALYLAAPLVAGCTDATACNFNPEANVNDGSCVASGCLEPAACNFNPSAGCAGEVCDYTCCPGPGCCGVGTVWDAEAGVCVPWAACPDVIYNPDFNGDGAITVADLLALLAIFEDVDSDGDGIFDSMDDCFGVYDGCGVCGGVGVDADDDGICDDVDLCVGTTDVVGVCGGSCTADADADGVCDTSDPCVGALDACGVCNGPGAVYTCGCADIPAGDCDCAGNQLDALGICGGPCTSDADGDGTCDDADPCVGALDVCGVCNGPGPSVPVIDQIIFVTDSAFIPQINYWYVFTFAVDTLYTYVCPVLGCTDSTATNFNPSAAIDDSSCLYGPAQCGGLSTVTFDGHTYALVGIGTQCWFAENLRSDTYLNGDPIPGNLTDAQWTSTSSGAQTVYGEGSSALYAGSSDEVANLATYGRLYNWYAVNDSRGLCPSGFHVPSDGEWMTLEMALGMTSSQANATDWRGTDQGTQMKTSSWGGTNSSGFTALPGGDRYNDDGSFGYQGNDGLWWSSSPNGAGAWYRHLNSGYSNVFRGNENARYGFSVRCLRDSDTEACLDPDGDGICAENEVSGCTDSAASNFNPAATEADESCVFPGPAQCGGLSAVTFDGHTYALVGIGTQCWFAENLRSDTYLNGDPIPGNLSDEQWSSAGFGAQAVYNNDSGSLATYGRLYNWYAVNDARGLCPSGFHVPSDEEWMTLEMVIGMTSSQVSSIGWRGTEQGNLLKSTTTNSPAWNGSNSYEFSGLPAGNRFISGLYFDQGERGNWWSASSDGEVALLRHLSTESAMVFRDYTSIRIGLSVRCIQDFEANICFDPDLDAICAEDEVTGCTDAAASNFNSAATENDGSCIYPGPAQCGGDSTVTFDGHTYALVGIGTQCWFAENLRSDTYLNGDPIPGNLTDAQWTSTSSGAQTVYGEGSSAVYDGSSDEVANLATYGRLYNWYAVNDSRGLCPSGFHVPSDGEWMTLEMALGMTSSQANSTGWRGTDQGAQLKTPSWGGTNSSGFSALPGGVRNFGNGYFYDQGLYGYWWSSSPNGTYAWIRHLRSGFSNVLRDYTSTRDGFSVRCVRDSETEVCIDPDGDGVCAENEVSGCTDSAASNFNPAATEADESCEYPDPCDGATNVTFDGHTYALVAIGTQCWFAENLRSDNYRNGDAIPGNLSDAQWTSTSSGAQTVYGEGTSTVYNGSSDEVANLATSGRLYNWYAVNDSRGLCPSGFHVPSDGEWMTLEMALGMTSSQANSTGWRGTDQGTQMKTSSWGGTNSCGFSALPSGYRDNGSGHYYCEANCAYLWSSSPIGFDSWNHGLDRENLGVYRSANGTRHGFSVRCVKD